MPIDFQPMQSAAPQAAPEENVAQGSPTIDFQPVSNAVTPTSMQNLPNPLTGAQKAVSGINAAAGSFLGGEMKAVGQLGTLGKTVIANTIGRLADQETKNIANKAANYIQDKFGAAKSFLADDPSMKADVAANPTTSSIAGGVGYLGASAAGAQAIAKPLEAGGAALSKGSILNSAAGAGALSGATQGAVMGGAANEANPVQGALTGVALGGAIGGVAGAASNYLKNTAAGINKVVDDAADNGLDMQSPQVLQAAKDAVKNQGTDVAKLNFKQQFNDAVNKKLDEIRPQTFVPNTSPAAFMADKVENNFKDVIATKNALYAPINADATPQVANNFNSLVDQLKSDLPKSIGLPTKALPENPTLQNMLNYRQTLRAKLDQAETSAQAGNLSREDAKPYIQLMNGLQTDIKAAAQKSGLGDQLAKAEQHYQENVLPFQVYGDATQDLNNEAFQKFSTQLKSPRPNLPLINNLAKTVGPEGRDLMGWAKLETNYNRSLSFQGTRFDPTKFDSALTKDRISGLADKIYSPEHLAAIKGITAINRAGKDIISAIKPATETPLTALNAPGKIVQGLLTSRPGMKLLSLIGTNSGNRGFVTSTVQDLLKSAAINTTASP